MVNGLSWLLLLPPPLLLPPLLLLLPPLLLPPLLLLPLPLLLRPPARRAASLKQLGSAGGLANTF